MSVVQSSCPFPFLILGYQCHTFNEHFPERYTSQRLLQHISMLWFLAAASKKPNLNVLVQHALNAPHTILVSPVFTTLPASLDCNHLQPR